MSRPGLVLFVAYPYPPCPAVGSIRSNHFAKYLGRFGYTVKVITGFQQDPPREEVIYVPDRQLTPSRTSVRGLSEMVLRKVFFPCDDGMLWAAAAAKAAGPVIRQHGRTAVFSTFPPVNSHLAAWLIKRKYGARWIADFRDPMVGSPARELARSACPVPSIAASADRLVQEHIFRDADVLVANTDTVLDNWRRTYPALAQKMVHIWNGFDPEEIEVPAPVPDRPFRVMAHTGSIYTGRHPGPLLESMERLIRSGRLDPQCFRLHLVGHIDWNMVPDREIYRRLSEPGCLNATGTIVSKREAEQAMRESDFLLLLDVIIPGAGQQLPSKVFEYIPTGRPILAITTRNSPADRVLAGSGVPYACIYNDSGDEEADRAVLELLTTPHQPGRPSEWFLTNFDASYRTRTLAALVDG